MARVAGLTGTVGSGKTTVARMFAERGAFVIDADEIAHRVIEPGQPAHEEIVQFFGKEVLLPDGRIDRKRLGRLVFGNEMLRKKLNEITHPRVAEMMLKELKKAAEYHRRILLDVPLLFEAGMEKWLRPVILVYATPEVCIARIMKRDGLSKEEACRRLQSQMPADLKREKADFIIDNTGSFEKTRQQVERMWHEIWDFHQGLII